MAVRSLSDTEEDTWQRFVAAWERLEQRPAGLHETPDEDLRPLLELIQYELVPLAQARSKILQHGLDELLTRFEHEMHSLSGASATLPPETLEPRLFALRTRLDLLQPIFTALEATPANLRRDILSRLKALEYHIEAAHESGDTPPPSLLRLHRLRGTYLDKQLRAFELSCRPYLTAKPTTADPDALVIRITELWQWIRVGEQMLTALLNELVAIHGEAPFLPLLDDRSHASQRPDTDPREPNPVDPDAEPKSVPGPAGGGIDLSMLPAQSRRGAADLQSLAGLLDQLMQRLIGGIEALPAESARAWIEQRGHEINDFAAELANHDGRFPLLDCYAAHRAQHHLAMICAALRKDPARCPAQDLRRLRRHERHLRSEWVDGSVSLRLKYRFGADFERRLDIGVLALIGLAILLLGIELNAALSPDGLLWLLLADTGICGFLLADFILRLSLAPDRSDYLRRHWLTDLLPAIPFPALALALHTMVLEAQGLYLLRLLRVVSVMVRKARPIINLVRIVLFAARGMDRLVRRYRPLLNWDIVFFEPKHPRHLQRMLVRWERLHDRLDDAHRDLGPYLCDHRDRLWQREIDWIEAHATALEAVSAVNGFCTAETHATPGGAHRIDVEDLIERLTHTEGERLLATLGPAFPHHIARLLWIARLPPLRWLPVFSDLIQARRLAGKDALLFTELTAKRLGRRLASLNRLAKMVADMHGVITPTQLIDRIGSMMVASMRRPRNRLLMLGAGFILVSLLVEILPFPLLETAAGWLRKTLGWPILLLGFIALAAVWIGTRFQQLAQTNADFYTRIAETKSLGLLGDVKRDRADHDQETLLRRVLEPEARVQGLEFRPIEGQPGSEQQIVAFGKLLRHIFHAHSPNRIGGLAERVYLLYRDYLRGVPFHSCNTGTVDQFLGNPSLHNIRTQFLGLDKREQKILDELDLRRPTKLFGASLWPRFITLAITQYTGQLVEEYNRHVLPIDERRAPLRRDEEIAHFQSWLAHRQGKDIGTDHECIEEPTAESGYLTTAFTTLDFLTNDPARAQAIRAQFGDEIARLVARDRRRLIHKVFGVLPYHRRAVAQRSINPYQLYHRFLAGGRVFILPITLLGLGFRGIVHALKWVWRTFEDLRRPQLRCMPDEDAVYSDHAVAWRKVLRIHKPLLLESIRLRARFDPEYLGLILPETPADSPVGDTLYEDLDRVNASIFAREPLETLRDERRGALQELTKLWTELGAPAGPVSELLRRLYPGHADHRRREALRTLAIAYVTGYLDLRRLFQLDQRLREGIEAASAARGRIPRRIGLWRRLMDLPQRRRRAQAQPEQFDRWWQHHGVRFIPAGQPPQKTRRRVARWWKHDVDDLAGLVELAVSSDFDPVAAAHRHIEHLLRNLSMITEQLVILRTVQTLGILELETSHHIVSGLGEYDDHPHHRPRVRIPTL